MDELLLDETTEFLTQLGQYFVSQTRTTMDFVDFSAWAAYLRQWQADFDKKNVWLETSKNSYQWMRFHW